MTEGEDPGRELATTAGRRSDGDRGRAHPHAAAAWPATVTRSLLDGEGLPPEQDGRGGQRRRRPRRPRPRGHRSGWSGLTANTGPAGGFRAGLVEAFSRSDHPVGLSVRGRRRPVRPAPPRLGDLVARVERPRTADERRPGPWWPTGGPSSGAAPTRSTWSRRPVRRTGFTAGGRGLLGGHPGLAVGGRRRRAARSRMVLRARGLRLLLPGPRSRIRGAGRRRRRPPGGRPTDVVGRDEAHCADRRPTDDDEAWRSYYHARNSFALIRRHGRPGWYGWQLAFTARQLQTARSRAERAAIVHGFWDGALGRMGENPRYGRRVGEFGPDPDPAEPVR